MIKLEDIKREAVLKGILPDRTVTVIDVKWHGQSAIEIVYKDTEGTLGTELIFRDREPTLDIVEYGLPWSFNADPNLFKLASEAYRIRLAYLFDPLLAVHTSLLEPLPHQIEAVYGDMLTRLPLRYLLADDPGSGKTIMTGLLIKELIVRGDLKRCLIVSPGNLAEQWLDEMNIRFQLPFEVITNDRIETARTGNIFNEINLAIARLDKLSRNEDLQQKLKVSDWDLIVCDEAHKMSASFFGGEINYTKRHKLGQLLSQITRHFLLLTATPHNGKEEDFQLFMSLLDGDRFEGRFRDGVHTADVSDIMRRMVKEQLLKFDGSPLFPPRFSYTVNYKLSDPEANLYAQVTDYVRNEFNRADALESEGRKGTIGFALTILQRRLASSPEAIYQSLKRRRERLEKRLNEEKLLKRGNDVRLSIPEEVYTPEELDDLDEAPEAELEEAEEVIIDQATAAQTIAELELEIKQLKELEATAAKVRASGTDKKWEELSKLLHDNPEMFDAAHSRRKLVIFTEHKDTLKYLADKIRSFIGRNEAVVVIHGGISREERKLAQEQFTHDKDVYVLTATDAAGEGINLQRAHLMINYDLPWNPNRIEQRFGRIHRIGQTEVCHLWNMVADETREGEVYKTLLKKLEVERQALGGGVFDVLGKAIDGVELKKLLIEAIRRGDQPEVKIQIIKTIEQALDRERLKELIEERALAHETMTPEMVGVIRDDMERAEARKLQPHFIASFFVEAFKLLGGTVKEREPKRFEINHVPAVIRNRDRIIGTGAVVLNKYERICFEKELINQSGKPMAAFVCPGHPLLDATIDIILERYRSLLKQGAVLVDEADDGNDLRMLTYLEHSIQDGRKDKDGNRRTISKQLQFIEIDEKNNHRSSGYAPYLNYRELKEDEQNIIEKLFDSPWLKGDFENTSLSYAITNIVPTHFDAVKDRRLSLIQKTKDAVHERLTKEISYWDNRSLQLKEQELAGRPNAKTNSGKARQTADELQARLQKRTEELEQEKHIAPMPPVVIGGALVIPKGLLQSQMGHVAIMKPDMFAMETKEVELIAMNRVMEQERKLGRSPVDVSAQKIGYDVESRTADGQLLFIEVKGRCEGAATVTVTKNEILTALNKPDQFVVAIVSVGKEGAKWPRYLRHYFKQEPEFGVTSINYDLKDLLACSKEPS
jgi:superfamily II DNA or RNA helicase